MYAVHYPPFDGIFDSNLQMKKLPEKQLNQNLPSTIRSLMFEKSVRYKSDWCCLVCHWWINLVIPTLTLTLELTFHMNKPLIWIKNFWRLSSIQRRANYQLIISSLISFVLKAIRDEWDWKTIEVSQKLTLLPTLLHWSETHEKI